jgi:hypothetical protein
VQRLNVCKVCGATASKNTCGEHFKGGRNRKRVWSVLHMKLKSRTDQLDADPWKDEDDMEVM